MYFHPLQEEIGNMSEEDISKRIKELNRKVAIARRGRNPELLFNLSKYSVCSLRLAVCGVSDTFSLYSLANSSPSTMIMLLNFVFQVNVFDIETIY